MLDLHMVHISRLGKIMSARRPRFFGIFALLIVGFLAVGKGETHTNLYLQSDADDALVRVSKRFIHGLTGRPTKMIEINSTGIVLLRGAGGEVTARGQLQQSDLQVLRGLTAGDRLANENLTCTGRVIPDAPSFEISIEKTYKVVTFKVYSHCRLPQLLAQLNSLLDATEKQHSR